MSVPSARIEHRHARSRRVGEQLSSAGLSRSDSLRVCLRPLKRALNESSVAVR
jgi:hypothetical protein